MIKLFHYVHCPYCVRVRMGLRFLSIPFESIVLPYDDEKTPLLLTGKKMLPIVQYPDGKTQNESLDILKTNDPSNKLHWEKLASSPSSLDGLLDKIGREVHSLAMPYWIWTPEFSPSARQYFQSKKEIKRGPFRDLVKKRRDFILALNEVLEKELLSRLRPFYDSDQLTIIDIMLAAHLWGMYVVLEYQFPPGVHTYLQKVKECTHFDYHEDFWT